MSRALKTFSEVRPLKAELAQPQVNSFAIDLAGLDLSEGQLAEVRQEAVKAAMLAANRLSSLSDIADSFSTFSTFSTFSSGSAGKLRDGNLKTNPLIDRIIKGG